MTKVRFGPTLYDKGETLANSAIITTHHFADDPSDQLWGYTEIKLDHVERAPLPDNHFRANFDPTSSIVDSRYSIAYTLGKSMLNLDGRILSTAQPLRGEVGENLSSWIKNGEFVAELENQDSDSQPIRADAKPGLWQQEWMIPIITAALIIIILLAKRPTAKGV